MPFPPEVEKWRSLVAKYFPPAEVDRALWVIQHESGGNPGIASRFNAGGGEDSHGLWQINLKAHPSMKGKTNDPEAATAYAAKLFADQGWQPWSVTHKGFPADLAPSTTAARVGSGNVAQDATFTREGVPRMNQNPGDLPEGAVVLGGNLAKWTDESGTVFYFQYNPTDRFDLNTGDFIPKGWNPRGTPNEAASQAASKPQGAVTTAQLKESGAKMGVGTADLNGQRYTQNADGTWDPSGAPAPAKEVSPTLQRAQQLQAARQTLAGDDTATGSAPSTTATSAPVAAPGAPGSDPANYFSTEPRIGVEAPDQFGKVKNVTGLTLPSVAPGQTGSTYLPAGGEMARVAALSLGQKQTGGLSDIDVMAAFMADHGLLQGMGFSPGQAQQAIETRTRGNKPTLGSLQSMLEGGTDPTELERLYGISGLAEGGDIYAGTNIGSTENRRKPVYANPDDYETIDVLDAAGRPGTINRRKVQQPAMGAPPAGMPTPPNPWAQPGSPYAWMFGLAEGGQVAAGMDVMGYNAPPAPTFRTMRADPYDPKGGPQIDWLGMSQLDHRRMDQERRVQAFRDRVNQFRWPGRDTQRYEPSFPVQGMASGGGVLAGAQSPYDLMQSFYPQAEPAYQPVAEQGYRPAQEPAYEPARESGMGQQTMGSYTGGLQSYFDRLGVRNPWGQPQAQQANPFGAQETPAVLGSFDNDFFVGNRPRQFDTGGPMMLAEPSHVIGDYTGQAHASLAELDPATGRPRPEMMNVTPLDHDANGVMGDDALSRGAGAAQGGMGAAMAPPPTAFAVLLETLMGVKQRRGGRPPSRPVGAMSMGAAA